MVKRKRQGVKKFQIGDFVTSFIDTTHTALTLEGEIVNIRKDGDRNIYVHFGTELSRFDSWFKEDQLRLSIKKKPETENEQKETGGGKGEQRAENVTAKTVEKIHVGEYVYKAWYFSPYPVTNCEDIYICESCFKFCADGNQLCRHLTKCNYLVEVSSSNHHESCKRKQVYTVQDRVIFEIDGAEEKILCQNLCLLSKVFLEDKSLYYEVDAFKFYLLYLKVGSSFQFAGYFSKEKEKPKLNLSCILVLPGFQGKGLGTLLVEYSYKISSGVSGPEQPVSKFAQRAYDSYWLRSVSEYLYSRKEDAKNGTVTITIKEISSATNINPSDVLRTLKQHGMLKQFDSGNGHCIHIKN